MNCKVYIFLYDLYFIRRRKYFFLLVKTLFFPTWFYYRFLSRKKKIFLFIRTDIFGIQLFEFQQLNQIALKLNETVHINHHPVVAGKFIFPDQIKQILKHRNVRIANHMNLICRIYSQDIENSISSRIKSNPKSIMKSFREFGYGGNLLVHYTCPPFPTFSTLELDQYRNYLKIQLPDLNLDKKLIAVHSRSGNYPRYKVPDRVKDGFRNTKFSEINSAAKHFDTDSFSFVRIGHYESFDSSTDDRILDARMQMSLDPLLQLAVFTNIKGYVGSSSGPLGFFAMQNLPCLLLSVYPIDTDYSKDPWSQIIVPKLIWDLKNQRYLSVNEQFNYDLIRLQNKYNDTLLSEMNLEPRSLPESLTSQIYRNWQCSIISSSESTKWLDLSVSASHKLSEDLDQPNLPIIPIEYFSYLGEKNL